MIRLIGFISISLLVSCSVGQETNKKVITQLHEVKSEVSNEIAPVLVILPPTVHAELRKPQKKLTKGDPDMERVYGKLSDTK